MYCANDKIAIDVVSAKDPARRNIKSRVLNFTPDALNLGVAANCRKTINDYRDIAMNTDVNAT